MNRPQTRADLPLADRLKSWPRIAVWTIAGAVLGTVLTYILFGLAYTGWGALTDQFAGSKPERSGDPIDSWAVGIVGMMLALPFVSAGFLAGAFAGFRIRHRRHQTRFSSENRTKTACRILVVLPVLSLLWNGQTVCADFGPKLMSRVRIAIQLDGHALPDGAVVALLAPSPWSGDGPANAASRVPGLVIPWKDESGKQWSYAGYLWGGELRNGFVTFRGFMDYKFRQPATQGIPSIVRLAVYDPQSERLYVTAPASPGQHMALMRADLSSDGLGDLTNIPIPFWQRVDFWKALLITLIVECFIVVWVVRKSRKTDEDQTTERPRGKTRLIRVCVLVNLLTLPLVWFFGGEFLFQFGFWLGTAVFLGLEAMAFLIEAVFYSGVLTTSDGTSRLPWSIALRASLLANLTTFLMGFAL